MDAERLKQLQERLDAVWELLLLLEDPEGDQAAQEFLRLLETLAHGSRDEKVWRLVAEWAEGKI